MCVEISGQFDGLFFSSKGTSTRNRTSPPRPPSQAIGGPSAWPSAGYAFAFAAAAAAAAVLPFVFAFGRYAAAKLLLLSFSTQLSSRRGGDALTLTSNAYDPGAINTPGAEAYAAKAQASRRMGIGPQVIIRKVLGFVLGPIFGPLFRYLARQFKRPVDEGGRGLVHLATSPDLYKISG